MKKAVIHIGSHKTGTTTIQYVLYTNAQLLKTLGIHYPLDFVRPDEFWCGQHDIGLYLRADDFYNALHSYDPDHIVKVVKSFSRDEDLLLSSETFCLLSLAHVQELRKLLVGFDCEVIFYVRQHDELLQALYQTEAVIKRNVGDFLNYFEKRAPSFNYYTIAQTWAKVFGKDKIHIRRYDRSTFPGKNVVFDFCNAIQSLFGRSLKCDCWKTSDVNLNSGLPAYALHLVKPYMALENAQEVVDAISLLTSQVHNKGQGKYEIASPSARKKIIAYYRKSNDLLAREYLGASAGEGLFRETEITQTDEAWEHEYVRNGATLKRLALEAAKCIKSLRHELRQARPGYEPQNKDVEKPGWSRYKSLHKIASAMSPRKWAEVIAEAAEGPVVLEGIPVPNPPASSIQEVFTSDSGKKAILGTAFPVYEYAMNQVRALGVKPQRLLDFGCGWGRFTRLFLHDVSEAGLFGVDPWEEAVTLSRVHMPYACFVKSDRDPPLPFADNVFDVVFANSVFSHLSRTSSREWGREISRILRPGGILVATTLPRNFFAILDDLKSGRLACSKPWHERFINSDTSVDAIRTLYDQGEFIYLDSHGTGKDGKYGWAFLPEAVLRKEWTEMSLVEYLSEPPAGTHQAIFVMRKL